MAEKAPKTAVVTLEYQNYIESPPYSPTQMYSQSCSSDAVTMQSWRQIWIDNVKATKARFGSFKENGLGKLFGNLKQRPCIVAGSGPSLKRNAHELKNKGDIPLISCLHNYHYFEDQGIEPDFYVTLDAGDVTVEEVSEGGTKTPQEYWDSTRNKTLIAFIGTSPKLFEKWQGKVYLFNAPVPDPAYSKTVKEAEPFHTYVSNGGNVLGACLYIAKGIMGANPIAFMGADFAFGYDKKFHAWDSKYDKNMGRIMRTLDVYGNKVLTWQSYHNFKNWFEWVALQVSGIYINCTEGGTFGAYPEGNLMAIRQLPISEFIDMYQMHENIRESCEKPEIETNKILF